MFFVLDLLSELADSQPALMEYAQVMIEGRVTSADALYRYARDTGRDWTRHATRTAWRDIGEATSWQLQISLLPPDRRIPWQWATEGSPNQRAEYMHVARVDYYDHDGQYTHSRTVSILDDRLLTQDDVRGELDAYADIYLEPGDAGYQIVGLIGLVRRG